MHTTPAHGNGPGTFLWVSLAASTVLFALLGFSALALAAAKAAFGS